MPHQTHSIDWNAASAALINATLEHLRRFTAANSLADFYGFGFTVQPYDGQVLLCANTENYHRQSWASYTAKYEARVDEETFRWDTGNWQWPAGILDGEPEIGVAWKSFAAAIQSRSESEMDGPDAYESYEILKGEFIEASVAALRQVIALNVFGDHIRHLGFTVMEIDDANDRKKDRKRVFDEFVRR